MCVSVHIEIEMCVSVHVEVEISNVVRLCSLMCELGACEWCNVVVVGSMVVPWCNLVAHLHLLPLLLRDLLNLVLCTVYLQHH